MPIRAARIFVVATVALTSHPLAGQSPPTLTLGKAVAKSRYTLGHLFALQELADQRVVVSDQKEQVFRVVDLRSGATSLLGTPGDGAGSYRAASGIVRLPGDSLGLFDPAGRKLLRLTPEGELLPAASLPGMRLDRPLGTLLGADDAGGTYFNVTERFDPTSQSLAGVTDLARFGPQDSVGETEFSYRTRRADQLRVSGIMPFYYRDALAIRQDGLIARVIADTYRVVWYRRNKEVGRTEPLPITPIPITKEEQQAIKDSVTGGMRRTVAQAMSGGGTSVSGAGLPPGVTVTSTGGGRTFTTASPSGSSGGTPIITGGPGSQVVVKDPSAQVSGGSPNIANLIDLPLGTFPEFKPPMPAFGIVAQFDRDGNLWVARERAHGDPIPHFDVISEQRGLIAKVNLPTGTRLVGFGKGFVYLAREDEGSDWLERFAIPKMP